MFRIVSGLATAALQIFLIGAPALATPDGNDKKEEGLLLKTTRTVEFDTDEVTWLSLDVSPNGSTLILEILGDLYTLPIGGGEAERITEGPAFDSQPRYSPDGEWLAFLSDRDGAENVWIARADGSEPKKLSQDTTAAFASPSWSPDGHYVVVSRAGGFGTFELWMYHVQGGSGVQITKAAESSTVPRDQRHNALGAVFSPDGRYLYYARKQGGFAYNVNFPLWQIARRDLVHGVEDTLTQELGSAIRPVLSPDGGLLVYGTRYDAKTALRVRNLRTGGDRWLRYPVQRDDQESRFTRDLLPGYAFTPDGEDIVLSYGGRIHRVNVETGSAQRIPFTARVTQNLGPRLHFPARVDDGPVVSRLIQDPSLSPLVESAWKRVESADDLVVDVILALGLVVNLTLLVATTAVRVQKGKDGKKTWSLTKKTAEPETKDTGQPEA